MRVLVLDILLNQTSDRKIPSDVLSRLYKEYRELARLEGEGYNSLISYLTSGNNGKKMQGVTNIEVFKYRLTDGDRILYTYGKYLPYLKEEKDSLVLLGYSSHDDQGFFAKYTDYKNSTHQYEYIKNIVSNLDALGKDIDEKEYNEEELYEIAALILSESFKGYVYNDEELAHFSADEIDKHLRLSKEQEKVIDDYKVNAQPTLIMGGAGTGKTLIAVHLLNDFNLANDGKYAIYFTQSAELLSKVKKQYDRISGNANHNNSIEFFNINDFCLEQLGLDKTHFMETKQFLDVFFRDKLSQSIKNRCKKADISDIDIWTEIRGTLKGGMSNWTRVQALSQNQFSESITNLAKYHYITRLESNKQLFFLADDIRTTIERSTVDDRLRETDISLLKKIIDYFSNFDSSIKTVDPEYYLSISDEYSILSKEQRQIVLDAYNEYDQYLTDNELYDENDIIRLMFEKQDSYFPQYDFLIVDEVQDYTELQIYFIYKICTNIKSVIFAGDVHQIINPTLFSVSKLKSLFIEDSKQTGLQERFLRTNFRCQQGVVNIANNLSELRRKIIASHSKEMEQLEESLSELCIYDPYRLNYSIDNVRNILLEIMKYPQVAVLVPDEQTKERLISIIGTDLYNENNVTFIFTVPEIKGMEYSYIVCFNLIGSFYNIWNSMLNDRGYSKKTKYRYYFNLLYVAITRAQQLLCFIDEKTVPALEEKLKLKQEDRFDAELMHFSRLDASLKVWHEQANKLRENGNYEVALQYYKKAGEFTTAYDIYQCKIGIAEGKRDYESAIKYSMLLNDSTKIKSFLGEIKKKFSLSKLAAFLLGESFDVKGLSATIEKEFAGFSDAEIESIYKRCNEHSELILLELLEKKRIPEIDIKRFDINSKGR